MQKMSSQIDNIVNAYKTLSKIPSIVGGKLNNAGRSVTAKWSVRNLDKGKSTKYQSSYTLDDKFNVIAESDFGLDVSNELISAVSPRETYRAVIREDRDNKEVKKQFLEVWRGQHLAHVVDLAARDLHGDVYVDSEFGSLDWSPDESSVLYIAEKKLPKSEPYIKRKPNKESKPADGSGETPDNKGEEYVYRQDWGEQLGGKHLSVIVVCQLETETFSVLEGLPESWCPGQVRFMPDGKSVYGVAWETEPRRLGLIFCTNRPSYVFTLTLDGKYQKISPEGMAVRSPRVTSHGDQILWLQRSEGGPHHACHAINSWNMADEYTVNVDIIDSVLETANHKPFHGIYSQALPARCFSSDGRRIVFSTPQKNEVKSYVVDNYGIDGGRLLELNRPHPTGSLSILDVQNDVILALWSKMTTPGQLFVGRLPPQGSEADLTWHRVTAPVEVPASVASAEVVHLALEHTEPTYTVKSYSALYMSPRVDDGKKLPLVVWPHGGPHSNFVDAYSLEAAFFTMLGFASLQINYRGSSGAGQESVDFLPKRVGSADVIDCKHATDDALRRFPIDSKNLCLFGGSHGGFLVTHLSGQYPDTYRAVVSRNPVTDVASMANYSDIPDWCAVEAGFQFTEQGPLSEDELLAMRRCSPLVHVHKVRAPTAMMLGGGDKRVPHYQGLEYCRRLKANGVPTRIYMYDDNHSLSTLPVEMDNLINSAAWFFEHME